MSEFDLIRDHFARVGAARSDVTLGVGDDCALLRVPPDAELAVSIDTLVAGVHFFRDCDPEALGHKCLAVGLSDLAAMGAEPAWATLAVTLPDDDPSWLTAFGRGFAVLASAHKVQLVGGDTTRGPLTVTVQVHGFVPGGEAARRSGARPGDLIHVSGTLGDAGLALRLLQDGKPVSGFLRGRLERPTPRVAQGLELRRLASAMIDISDGLAADLGHILETSGVGAEIELASLPLSADVSERVAAGADWGLPMSSGDDYELCFTVPPDRLADLESVADRLEVGLSCIGCVTDGDGLRCLLPNGTTWEPERSGYDHFSDAG
ncbi:MAG: thiamine-phosphate kinase [Pseudomonadota bacterium]|nr:thiamine-phosphate kinase [Pseudomonadota bacterium]